MSHSVQRALACIALALFAGPAITGSITIVLHLQQLPTDRPPKPAVAVGLHIVRVIFSNKVLVRIGNVAVVQYNQCAGVVTTIVDGPAKVGLVTPDQEDVLREQAWVG